MNIQKKQQFVIITAMPVIMIGLMMSSAPNACAETFRIGMSDIPPQTFLDENGQPKGAAVDYFKIVAQRMGLSELVFGEYPISRLLYTFEIGEIDMILFIAKTPERAAKFQFPAKPYYVAQAGLAVLSSSPLQTIVSANDLAGLRIGVQQDSYLPPILKHSAITLDQIAGSTAVSRNLQKLLAGRLDAVSTEFSTLQYEIAQLGQTQAIKLLPLPETSTPVYSLFSAKRQALLPAYEAAIREGDDQLYQELLEAYYTVPSKE